LGYSRTHTLETVAPAGAADWLGSVRLSGVSAFGRAWDVQLEGGSKSVAAA
jgi:hypothetical protein